MEQVMPANESQDSRHNVWRQNGEEITPDPGQARWVMLPAVIFEDGKMNLTKIDFYMYDGTFKEFVKGYV